MPLSQISSNATPNRSLEVQSQHFLLWKSTKKRRVSSKSILSRHVVELAKRDQREYKSWERITYSRLRSSGVHTCPRTNLYKRPFWKRARRGGARSCWANKECEIVSPIDHSVIAPIANEPRGAVAVFSHDLLSRSMRTSVPFP